MFVEEEMEAIDDERIAAKRTGLLTCVGSVRNCRCLDLDLDLDFLFFLFNILLLVWMTDFLIFKVIGCVL